MINLNDFDSYSDYDFYDYNKIENLIKSAPGNGLNYTRR